jgi:hypothetical protein
MSLQRPPYVIQNNVAAVSAIEFLSTSKHGVTAQNTMIVPRGLSESLDAEGYQHFGVS